MTVKIDPFTLTPGVAGKPYIDCGIAEEIIANFKSEESSKYVYKITGLRGSGKSVEYGKVLQTLEKDENWLVYPLAAEGDGVETLISYLSQEDFISNKKTETLVTTNASAQGGIPIISGKGSIEVTKTYSENSNFYNAEATLANMIAMANKNNRNVLVMIDDISKTENTVRLLSVLGTMFNRGRRVYLVVSGLSKNIEDFFVINKRDSNSENISKSLSFFRRGDTREVKPLDKFDIAYNYEKFLDVDAEEAKKLYDMTLGYAYAYQVLGSLYFNKGESETIKDIIPDYERILFKSYNLDWPELTDAEQEFIRSFYKGKTGRAKDTKAHMSKPESYNAYRDRLIDKHFFSANKRGYLKPKLPRFDRFIKIWCDE
ncbi:hypothetical protein SAMN05216249_10210 [Acetitomaculum ruminis DSM 5522]|uniref:AAA ATPase domain-containing protein n=1 Tax=Acetitomaculum ruminis DSM 5522 TaxID=1120918 RepID=A0A1I0VH94_9FIRM|nr:hypothetical protein [Acetitomaculum ruminis]SFA75682.1 hypothetical protein SAMN05216249_10210 [Acetitomaculum ruminis DSM 5522]